MSPPTDPAPPASTAGPATSALVQRCEQGDEQARAQARAELFARLYGELHRLARREAGRYGSMATLGSTTLLHEAFLNLGRREHLAFQSKAHFLGYAARAMRGLVIDHVRSRQAAKRGGGLDITSLSTTLAEQSAQPQNLQSLSDALDELAQQAPALAHLVDLKFFCGFSLIEVAAMTGVSERTAQRQWEKARLLLHGHLQS